MQHPESQRSYTTDLLAYCLIAFSWSWLCWLSAKLVLPFVGIAATILGILASFGPSSAAIVLSTLRQPGIRVFLSHSFHWRVNWIWYGIAFLLPAAIMAIALFFLNTIALSILFTWLFNQTGGSVVIAIVLHTAVNSWSWVIPILPKVADSLRPYSIATVLLWSMAVVASLTSLRQFSQSK